jgi:hypothetical protein
MDSRLSKPQIWFVVALLFLIAIVNKPAVDQIQCGPPTHSCSRTDQGVIQPDAPPVPNFGGLAGANMLATDPLYNNVEIVRSTDAGSDPANVNTSYMAELGGSSVTEPTRLADTRFKRPALVPA